MVQQTRAYKTGYEAQTWPGCTHRHAVTLNCNLPVSLRQPPVETPASTVERNPPAAHRQVQDEGGCQPEPDVSPYCTGRDLVQCYIHYPGGTPACPRC